MKKNIINTRDVSTLTMTPTKFCRLGSTRLRNICTALFIMDFTILRMGEPTALGNRSLVMQYGANIVEDFGEVVIARIARIVVRSENLTAEVGDTVTLDMDSRYKFEQREFTPDEGENAGTTYNLTWITKQ